MFAFTGAAILASAAAAIDTDDAAALRRRHETRAAHVPSLAWRFDDVVGGYVATGVDGHVYRATRRAAGARFDAFADGRMIEGGIKLRSAKAACHRHHADVVIAAAKAAGL